MRNIGTKTRAKHSALVKKLDREVGGRDLAVAPLPRRLYEEVPFDSRFVGWSGEDESAALAWTCLAGQPWRGTHPLWHLYHPPQLRMSRRWGSPAARALAARYRKAARSPQAMRAILDETRTVPA